MHTVSAANPFALLLNPAAVLEQVERSERLGRLQSRICRPLDKPVPGSTEDAEPEILSGQYAMRDDADGRA